MGRSAKMMKRPTKSEKVSRQINKPAQPAQRIERSLSPDAGPSTIPLFNTSVPGRQTSKPDPRTRKSAASTSSSRPATSDLVGEDVDDEVMSEDGDGDDGEEDAAHLGGKKKKGGLKDKVRAAKNAMKEDDARSAAKVAGNRRKGPKSNVLGSVDYVKLHESRPGKKKFR
ncbi:hypothetical protein JCM10908_006706 [Rhodotorula pacifica]|uniref:uncharacterized protein n=1 Tax=Rhodotorula pacifica TaxID=1495444 RepID=UPI0031735120